MRTRTCYVCSDVQTRYECGCLGGCTDCDNARLMRFARVALCESRHEIPQAVDGAIFGQSVDPTSPLKLEIEARRVIRESGVERLTVYVTGLSVALGAVINACHTLGVRLTLMHYDREKGRYFPQIVR